MTKWVYSFGNGTAQGSLNNLDLLGDKGANLAEMSRLGLPVPPGFTITTAVCNYYYANANQYPDDLSQMVEEALNNIEILTNKKFGATHNPLFVSVRSGAPASMPGMMDTVLNLGLNDETVKAITASTGDERFAYDSYRRFIQMYSDVVLGIDNAFFEEILDDAKALHGYELDTELNVENWKEVINLYKDCVKTERGEDFPQDPMQQLWGAIGGVFSSWMTVRAVIYRELHDIPTNLGTAANIQAMVFGNMDNHSATGVALTRNPATGKKELYGEFLINAQGEDVVSGINTVQPITETARIASLSDKPSLEILMPEAFAELCEISNRLEQHYRNIQNLEFTIEKGKLWMLQTRLGKCTAHAALTIAVNMVEQGLITKKEAIMRIEPQSLDQILHTTIDPKAQRNIIANGLPVSPGAATGAIVFSAEAAEIETAKGHKVVLVRIETSPEDIHGMHVAEAILTTRGGMTSHAAVVARGMGKPCVSGASTLKIDYQAQTMTILGQTLHAGDVITIDGSGGQVLKGSVHMLKPKFSHDFTKLMEWTDSFKRMKIRANAETLADANAALSFGAEGIGLCRTEHMFFSGERIIIMREMILSNDEQGRREALNKLLPMQRSDFIELFNIMNGLPVTIRLFDPPLHEFLPKSEIEIEEVAAVMGVSAQTLRERTQHLHEFNPMLGLRGCRLAITYPEIVEMQARAIFEAAALTQSQSGVPVKLEIMVPLVALKSELDFVKSRINDLASQVMRDKNITIHYSVGTMIELPRAALRAAEIAQTAEFFSFGTNDLTQTTFGISRDDATPYLNAYLKKELLAQDPFISIDRDGVGELIDIATKRGRAERPNIKLGICGEHAGDPNSILLCEEIGLDYISCSPFRILIARLAAAQATIKINA